MVDYSTSFKNVQELGDSAVSIITSDGNLPEFIRIVDGDGNPSDLCSSITHINLDGQLYPIIRTSNGGIIDTAPHASELATKWGTVDENAVKGYKMVR